MEWKTVLATLTTILLIIESSNAQGPTSFLDLLTGPGAQGALTAADKLKETLTETGGSRITTQDKSTGFEFLDMHADAQFSRGVRKPYLLKLLNRYLNPIQNDNGNMRDVIQTLQEFIQDDVEEHQEQFFGLLSKGGSGEVRALFVYFKQRDDGKFNFKRMMFRGKFTLAADLVVTHSSRRGLFTSSSRSVINYLPRKGVKAQDIKNLLNFIVPKIAAVMNDFLPPNV